MANSSSWQVGVIRVTQFAAAVAIVLWPAGGWAQSESQATFTASITQKVDARSSPAKVTSEEDSALTSKGYVLIGRIRASQPGKKTDAEVTKQMESAILRKASEAGGDFVRFSKEGAIETTYVPTGKTRKECTEHDTVPVTVWSPVTTTPSTSCSTDIHGFQHCNKTYSTSGGVPTQGKLQRCTKLERVPITRKEKSLASEGMVWRYYPKLAADIARAPEARGADVAPAAEAHGADVNAKDDKGEVPLFYAAHRGDKDMVELLLSKRADVNARDDDGWTPLHGAALSGHKDVAEVLLAYGADVNAKDDKGRVPLYWAAFNGNKDMAELLLSKRAAVNARDDDGWTPLFSAAYNGDKDMAELLLAHGADVDKIFFGRINFEF